jgi:hypothetical protein
VAKSISPLLRPTSDCGDAPTNPAPVAPPVTDEDVAAADSMWMPPL